MVSNKEICNLIDEVVDWLNHAITLLASEQGIIASEQATIMRIFRDDFLIVGLSNASDELNKMQCLGPDDLPAALDQLRRELLKIRDSQFR